MALNVVYSFSNEGVKSTYNAILSKLQATVTRHQAAFPQLSAIDKLLDISMPEADNDEDYLRRLEELCSYLYELSISSYVLRHLHYNLCADVEAARNKTFLMNQEETYLILPR